MILSQKFFFKIFNLKIDKAFDRLLKIKSLSTSDFNDWKYKKRWEIAKYHYHNNKYYKSMFSKSFPEKWEDLPIIYKTDLQRDIDVILSNEFLLKDVYVANTSGSSGHPFYFAKDKECHSLTWAYIKWRYESLGISLNDLEARFYGIPLDFFSNIKEKFKDRILKRIRLPIYDFSDYNLNKYVKKFKLNKIDYIYGYTNSIVLFSRFLLKNNIHLLDICPSIKLIIVTSEVCTKEDRSIIEKAINVPLYNEYGASEFAYIGYQHNNNSWRVAEEMVYVERHHDGSLLITDLHNKAFPFVRYNIGDIAQLYEDKSGNTYIDSLEGRTNDTIKLPSGKKAAGLTFYYISRSILEKSGSLKEFIIRQVALDKFIFDVVSDQPLSNDEVSEIKSNLDIYLEKDLKVEINRVKRINRPVSGKIKHFYSELNKN